METKNTVEQLLIEIEKNIPNSLVELVKHYDPKSANTYFDAIEPIVDESHVNLKLNEFELCKVCDYLSDKCYDVDGTYKFTHGKWEDTTYSICPACMYLAIKHTEYSNILSDSATYDEHGLLKYKNNMWVIEHPSLTEIDYDDIISQGDYINKLFCNM